MASERARRAPVLLAAGAWLVAIVVAGALGVLGLRIAGGTSAADTVLSADEARALASAGTSGAPTSTPGQSEPGTSQPTPAPSTSGATGVPTDAPATDPAGVVRRAVPGAVLGLRCEGAVPVLVWSVPDAGWSVRDAEPEDGGLRVRLESGDDEVRVSISCASGTPDVVAAERKSDG